MWVLLNPVNAVLMTTYLTPLREEVENAAADLEQKADGEEDAEEKEKKRLKPAFKPDPRCAFPTAIQRSNRRSARITIRSTLRTEATGWFSLVPHLSEATLSIPCRLQSKILT